tara:strand:+ start:43838 stop:45070 length:1233 start_codon:yes stop_codon:yes gene_type:complete
MNTKTCIVGLGYIGLPTAAVIAQSKQSVLGLDVDNKVVEIINNGDIHIVEPGLEKLVKKVVDSGYLRAINSPEESEIFVIAVPTPFKNGNNEPDLSHIKSAVKNIASVIKSGDLVILESTSPVGTTELLRDWLRSERSDLTFSDKSLNKPDIFIAYCPERVLPGNTLNELVNNDRVIGGLCSKSSDLAEKFYKSFIKGKCFKTDARTAELTKLTENSFRDLNIAFANELSLVAKNLEIDVWELIDLANMHPRVDILKPGAGVGGHCIAVDPWFIISKSPEAKLIKQARLINDYKPKHIVEEIKDFCSTNPNVKSISVFGLTYKPNIDDIRESPAFEIYSSLNRDSGCKISAVDPYLENGELQNQVDFISSKEAIEKTDLLILLVPHSEFKNLFKNIDSDQLVLDYCGLLH